MIPTSSYIPGLAGVIAAQTRLSRVDGERGELVIAGFPLETLVRNATYEEAVYALWFDRLPTASELADFQAALAAARALPLELIDLLRAAAARRLAPMDALGMGAEALKLAIPTGGDLQAAWFEQAVPLLAKMPVILAAYWRLLHGEEPIEPDPGNPEVPALDHAGSFLYMLTGERPAEARSRAISTYMTTVIDHGLNVSTFTARTIISTDSDLISAVSGAIGALKGPKHGGAPGPALDTVLEIGRPERAEPYLRAMLERGERIMGFGHRVYKVYDPRAVVLAEGARALYAGDPEFAALYDLARHVEKTAIALLEEYKPGRRLQTNVEFYTALILHGAGLEADLFTPLFALARTAGWIAHAVEQHATGRINRPRAEYIGEEGRVWVPIEAR